MCYSSVLLATLFLVPLGISWYLSLHLLHLKFICNLYRSVSQAITVNWSQIDSDCLSLSYDWINISSLIPIDVFFFYALFKHALFIFTIPKMDKIEIQAIGTTFLSIYTFHNTFAMLLGYSSNPWLFIAITKRDRKLCSVLIKSFLVLAHLPILLW